MKKSSTFSRLLAVIFSCILLAPLLLRAADEEPVVTGAKLVDYGLYQTKRVKQVNSPDTNLGYTSAISSTELIQQTNHIPAKLNTNFGFRYIVTGNPPGTILQTTVKVIHPKTTNPETGEVTTVDQWHPPAKLGEVKFSGWRFSHAWEAMPGKWTIQIIYDGKVLTEKEFTVEKSKEP